MYTARTIIWLHHFFIRKLWIWSKLVKDYWQKSELALLLNLSLAQISSWRTRERLCTVLSKILFQSFQNTNWGCSNTNDADTQANITEPFLTLLEFCQSVCLRQTIAGVSKIFQHFFKIFWYFVNLQRIVLITFLNTLWPGPFISRKRKTYQLNLT